jgi:hypothetical protein
VFGVDFGLRWVRRRQRSLSRAVLALFCVAWLQAAIVPCVMAHSADPLPQSQPAPSHHHDAGAAHDHAAMSADAPAAPESHPCLYCPPGQSAADDCDDHGGCAYPHEPQVDARAASMIFAAVPVSFVAPAPGALVVAERLAPAAPAIIPRISLSVSYCRFIE